MENDNNTSDRPVLKFKLTKFDVVLEVLAFLLLVTMWGYVLFHWSSLPEKIPVRIVNAEPKIFAPKAAAFIIPVAAIVVQFLLFAACRLMTLGNYIVKITPKNAERQYQLATRFMRFFAVLCHISFWRIVIITCTTGKLDFATNGLTMVLWCITMGAFVFYVVRAFILK